MIANDASPFLPSYGCYTLLTLQMFMIMYVSIGGELMSKGTIITMKLALEYTDSKNMTGKAISIIRSSMAQDSNL